MPSHRFPVPIVIDTREQRPYTFEGLLSDAKDGRLPIEVDLIRRGIDAGDYSLEGFENRIAIERKSLADLFGTLGQGRARFERELERLAELHYAAVVIEADWQTILTSPPAHSALPPKTVFRSIIAWSQRYPTIHWWPMGDRRLAEVTTFRLLARYIQEHPTSEQ